MTSPGDDERAPEPAGAPGPPVGVGGSHAHARMVAGWTHLVGHDTGKRLRLRLLVGRHCRNDEQGDHDDWLHGSHPFPLQYIVDYPDRNAPAGRLRRGLL